MGGGTANQKTKIDLKHILIITKTKAWKKRSQWLLKRKSGVIINVVKLLLPCFLELGVGIVQVWLGGGGLMIDEGSKKLEARGMFMLWYL